VGVSLSWYEATRHSFVSRNLRDGVSLDEVSAAVGHSSPVVTGKHYARYVRKTYSEKLRGLAN
jgi:integrase